MTTAARARGRQLATYRRLRGLTQERLAFAAGLQPPAIHLLEHGRRKGKVETWVALAEALEIPPLALIAIPKEVACADS